METVIDKAIQWFKNISEATREITSGNASHKCPSIRGLANRSAEYLEKHKKYYSHIKWQTGEPKEIGRYLVTTIDGHIATEAITRNDVHDKHFFKTYVKAWCKLSDIKPYKEEEE